MATKEQWEIIKSDFLRGNVDRFKNDLNFKGVDITPDFIMQNAALSGYNITPEQRTELAQTAANAYQAKYGTISGGREKTANDFGGSMAAVNAAYPVGVASQAQIDNPANYSPDFKAATAGSGAAADFKVQLKDKAGNPITVYNSSIKQLIADGVLPNGTVAPTGPTIGQPRNPVNRDLTAEQNFVKNWGGKGGALPTPAEVNQGVYGSATPSFTTKQGAITSEAMKPENNIDLSGTTGTGESGKAATSAANTAAASVIADIQAHQAAVEATKTATQKQDESLLSGMLKDLGSLAGKSAYEEEQRKLKMGEGEQNLNTQLTKSKNRIESLQAEKQKVLTDIEGKPITLSSIAGQQAQTIAKYNSEILMETALANGLMNNITLAESQIKQAVDAKYAPIEEAISIAKAQREAIAGTLTKDEKIQSDALDAADKAKLQAIADKKTEETNIKNIMLEAMKAGITDKNILDKIVNSKSLTEAMGVLGDNIPKNADEKALVLDMAGKYSDAGILPTDTLAQATAKQKNSKIYQDQIRGPVGNSNPPVIGISKTDIASITNALLSEVGADGFVSPQDYEAAKQDWISHNGEPAAFDAKFKNRRNPDNPNYKTTKDISSSLF